MRFLAPILTLFLALFVFLGLAGCATSATGEQAQDTSQGTVEQRAWGGLFHAYAEKGRGSRRTTTAPVLDKNGNPVLNADGLPLFTTIVEEGASGPLVLNYGTISADIDQSPQGSQAGSGTQGKTDTSSPTNTTSPSTDVSGLPGQ